MKIQFFVIALLINWHAAVAVHAHGSHRAAHDDPHVSSGLEDRLHVLRQLLDRFQRTGASDALARARALATGLAADSRVTPEGLYLAARTAQAAHDFAAAKSSLARLLAFAPRDPAASALLASIHSVEGDVEAALTACGYLLGLQATGCRLQARLAGQEVPDAAFLHRFQQMLTALEHLESAETLAWLWATLGDASMSAGQVADAVSHYRNAMRRDALVRYRSALADALFVAGKPQEALDVIGPNPQALGLRVKRAVALQRLNRLDRGAPDYLALAAEMAHLRDHEDMDHAREIAEYLLDVENRPAQAAYFARAGLELQREREDIVLARRSRLLAAGNQTGGERGSREQLLDE